MKSKVVKEPDSHKSLKLQAARLKAIATAPYLATAIWSLHPVETDLVPSMGVDKYWRLYWNAEALEKWTVDESAAVVIHEVWHLLRDHPGRAELKGIDPKNPTITTAGKHLIWNVAADCEINDGLRSEKINLPDGSIHPDQFDLPHNKIVEWYYDKLLKNAKIVNVNVAGDGGEAGNDGSGATGIAGEWELAPDNPHAPSTSKAGGHLIARQVAEEIQSKSCGNVPGHAERWADTIINPQIDWRQELASAIRRAASWASGRVDYSYSRPSRRQAAYGRVIMPSMVAPQPEATIIIDTSGSMRKADLTACLGETRGILDVVANKVTIYAVDAAVHKKQSIYSHKEIELIGGGGTDMGAGLRAVNDDGASICIVMTDGYTPWPEQKPPKIGKVIVCLIASKRYGSPKDPPSWARIVTVDIEDD